MKFVVGFLYADDFGIGVTTVGAERLAIILSVVGLTLAMGPDGLLCELAPEVGGFGVRSLSGVCAGCAGALIS